MRRLAVLILISAVSFAPASLGDFNRTTGLIDIPTAEWLDKGVVKVITNGTLALGDDLYPAYFDFGLGYGFLGIGEVVLNAYTFADYSLHVAFKLREEKDWAPALGLGIQELTYRSYISSVGGGEYTGFPDDVQYWKTAGRPSEIFSLYFVATKDLHPYGSYTLGLGRGRFVGYGPNSHWFNMDNFFREDYRDTSDPINNMAFGLFMGAKWELFPGFSLMMEFDGRDGNAGVRYEHKYFDVSLAGTHLDQIGHHDDPSVPDTLNPRIALGFSANTSWLYELPKEGVIAGRVVDEKTKTPLVATVSFPGTNIPSTQTTQRGVFSAKLPAGTYAVQGNKDGYYWKQSRVSILAGTTVRCDFALARKPPPEELQRAERIKEHLDKGLAYFLDDKYREAAAELEKVLALDRHNEEAKKLLDKVHEMTGEQVGDHRAKALSYASRGQLREAINEWETILAIDPMNREAMNQIVNLEERLRAPKKKPSPKAPPTKKEPPKKKVDPAEVNRLFRDGVSLFLAEKYEEAIKIFNKVLNLDPKHADAAKYRSRARARLKAMGGG